MIALTSITLSGIAHADQSVTPAPYVLAQAAPAPDDANQSPLPIPQDQGADVDKAKPADEMLGDTAPTGTDLNVDPDSATADGIPRDAERSIVNTESDDEAEVGIPDSQTGILSDTD